MPDSNDPQQIRRLTGVILEAIEQDLTLSHASPAELGAALATATVSVMETIIERSEEQHVEQNRNSCLLALHRMAEQIAAVRPDVQPKWKN